MLFYTRIMCGKTSRLFAHKPHGSQTGLAHKPEVIRMHMHVRTYTHFVNFAYISREAQMLHGHMLLMSLYEVFACVSLPFFDKYCMHVQCQVYVLAKRYFIPNTVDWVY